MWDGRHKPERKRRVCAYHASSCNRIDAARDVIRQYLLYARESEGIADCCHELFFGE